ncbi:putative S-adenosylmethionine-dependent methyltransferase, partial [Eremomyces bilateralis CBS 781.70]
TAIFNFQSLLLVILLMICTSTYIHFHFPGIMDRNKDHMITGFFWKCARVGERLSPYVALCCLLMAVSRSGGVDGFPVH